MNTTRVLDFTVFFQPAIEGGYDVIVPALPGCVTQGRTLDEAKAMAEDAIRLYCESLRDDGEPIPQDRGEFVGHVQINAFPA
ncbi:type II toxin-antitoxin system HicB family antitoxin [Candidatus Uhrbacteria bacterium]|nr:type II toxin-antitoxin system HicB family antitoxin [Candidatus Uhrbacteria bacterium]